MPRRDLRTKPQVSPGRRPFGEALEQIVQGQLSSFTEAEPIFLAAMYAFDQLVIDGTANKGDIQNGKGDFFNDVLAVLVENRTGEELYRRPAVPGLLFERHNLDIAWPGSGDVELMVETKATGIPKHPGNKRQPHPEGRAGHADLEKRIKEAAFKDIDIKGEAARRSGKGGGARVDLSTWLHQAPPRSFFLLSARVRDEADRKKTVQFAHVARDWFDGCGLFAFGLTKDRSAYEAKNLGSTTIQLDRVLFRITSVLQELAQGKTPTGPKAA